MQHKFKKSFSFERIRERDRERKTQTVMSHARVYSHDMPIRAVQFAHLPI